MNATNFSSAIAIFTALLLCSASLVDASCTASDATCQEGAGDCTAALRLALLGNLNVATNSAFYGKYCGGSNTCEVVEDMSSSSADRLLDEDDMCEIDERRRLHGKKGSKKGKKHGKKGKEDNDPCPAIPCDDIDISCSMHDACLVNQILTNPPPDGRGASFPQRCVCDVGFIYDMAIQATTTQPTGLCDAAFYTEQISEELTLTGIQFLQHEAAFMGAPFCCAILLDTDGDGILECGIEPNTDQAKFPVALQFCQQLIGGLEQAGVVIC